MLKVKSIRSSLLLACIPLLSGCFVDGSGTFSNAAGNRILSDGAHQMCAWPETEDRNCGTLTATFIPETGKTLVSFGGETEGVAAQLVAKDLFVIPVARKAGDYSLVFGELSGATLRVAYLQCGDVMDLKGPIAQRFIRPQLGGCEPRELTSFDPLIPRIRSMVRSAEKGTLAAIIVSPS